MTYHNGDIVRVDIKHLKHLRSICDDMFGQYDKPRWALRDWEPRSKEACHVCIVSPVMREEGLHKRRLSKSYYLCAMGSGGYTYYLPSAVMNPILDSELKAAESYLISGTIRRLEQRSKFYRNNRVTLPSWRTPRKDMHLDEIAELLNVSKRVHDGGDYGEDYMEDDPDQENTEFGEDEWDR